MSVRIAIVDPLPMFRHGVREALEGSGFISETPDDVVAWVRARSGDLVLLTVRQGGDWTLLETVCQVRNRIAVVSVLDDATVPSYVRALDAGAVGAVPRDATAEQIRETCAAAVRGVALLPFDVIRAVRDRGLRRRGERPPDVPTEREIEWLRQLAHGATMARVASRAGYSERMMFRLLREVYTKLDVANRTEAIVFAQDRGWL